MKSRSWSATSEVETFSAVPHSRHMTSSSMSGSEARGSAAPAAGASEREREQRGEQDPAHDDSSSSGGSVASSHSCVIGIRRTAATLPSRSIT